jgi:hypothetical protein
MDDPTYDADLRRHEIAMFASLHSQITDAARRAAGYFTKIRTDRDQSLRKVGDLTGVNYVTLHRFEKCQGLLKPDELSKVIRWMNAPSVTGDTTVSAHDDDTER